MNDIKKLVEQHKKLAEDAMLHANAMINKLPSGSQKELFKSAMADVKGGNVDMNNLSTFVEKLKSKLDASSNTNN